MVVIPTEHSYIRLSELSGKVEDAIRRQFSTESFWVVAEISGHKFYAGQSRHYFEFVEKAEGQHDPIAKFRAVAWVAGSESIRQFEEATRQQFSNGIQVLSRVKVEFHQVHGLTLVLQEVDQFYTLGNLERQRLEILHRLVQDNPGMVTKSGDEYVTRNKQLVLADVIQHLAIIGSPNSEGYVDFMHTLDSNRFGYTFRRDIYQSSVQGSFAEEELVKTMVRVYDSGIKYDAIIIIRGGGAKTDFLVFDTYRLARAVARFPIPVITGIGHHKDVSITDMMAHTSTKTPTKAAEFIISHNRAFEDEVTLLQKSIVIRTQRMLSAAQQDVKARQYSVIQSAREILKQRARILERTREDLSVHVRELIRHQHTELQVQLRKMSTQPLLITAGGLAELRRMREQLQNAIRWNLSRQQEALARHENMVKLMHPDNVLKKGFAILSSGGKILNNDEEIISGSSLDILTEHYKTETTVINKIKREDGKPEL